MKDDDKYSPPEASLGDHAHTLARAGVGSIPLAGAAATELFQKLIAPPLEKRRQEWMKSVAVGLRQLEEQQRLTLDDLSENDTFIDAVMSASQAAIRTSHEGKREALKNAVLNSALPDPPDESRQQIFIGLVCRWRFWIEPVWRFGRGWLAGVVGDFLAISNYPGGSWLTAQWWVGRF
jgi:hypothetical protein